MSNDRDTKQSIIRGILGKCPHCGEGKIFSRYLVVDDTCQHCKEELHHHRADDAPTWITILLLGHLLLPLVMSIETSLHPEFWVHLMIWPPVTLALCLLLLPRAKGAVVGLQWACRMHGFSQPSQK